jgi:hypothetical protein
MVMMRSGRRIVQGLVKTRGRLFGTRQAISNLRSQASPSKYFSLLQHRIELPFFQSSQRIRASQRKEPCLLNSSFSGISRLQPSNKLGSHIFLHPTKF